MTAVQDMHGVHKSGITIKWVNVATLIELRNRVFTSRF